MNLVQVVAKRIRMAKNVLVLRTGNSCRSQIADGYLKAFSPEGVSIYSAGVETHGVNPKAIRTMSDDGIDISSNTSNNVNEYGDIISIISLQFAIMLKKDALIFHLMHFDFTRISRTQQKRREQKRRLMLNLMKYEIS